MSATSTSIDDVERRLRERANEPPPESWMAEKPGDEIIGVLRRVESNQTSYGPCEIAVLESMRTPGRFASVWLLHTTLLNQFKKANLRIGEVVLVRYEGKVERDGQQPYHLWKVIVDRPEGQSAFGPTDAGGAGDQPPAADPQTDTAAAPQAGDGFSTAPVTDAGSPPAQELGAPPPSDSFFASGPADDDIPF